MERLFRLISGVTIALAASLVFLIQPFVGRLLTPRLGGAAQVWIAVMLFFQVALLVGYWSADALRRVEGYRRQRLIYVGLMLGAVILFCLFGRGEQMDDVAPSPVGVLLGLAKTVGLPFVILSMASPMLQYWYGRSPYGVGRDPYRLYVASNFGSLAGLLVYPLVLSRYLALGQHRIAFVLALSVTLCLLIVLVVVDRAGASAAVHVDVASDRMGKPTADAPSPVLWVITAFVPSSLMLGLTSLLAMEIASVPMVWLVPLVLYLVSMMVGFSGALSVFKLFVRGAVLVAGTFVIGKAFDPRQAAVTFLVVLFFALATVFHAALYERRPPKRALTRFYGFVSLGGALGGLFNGVIAPQVFTTASEFQLVLYLAALLLPCLLIRPSSRRGRLRVFAAWSVMIVVGVFHGLGGSKGNALHARSFFGVYEVSDGPDGSKLFSHGSTVHGIELGAGQPRRVGYYVEDGPVSDVFDWAERQQARTLVAGLGAGALAAYAEQVPVMKFIEIDPLVTDLARREFSYLKTCGDRCSVIHGDARLVIDRMARSEWDLMIVDAYSSASVPIHLLTQEALELYLSRLGARGLLTLHISNRMLRLEPVFARIANAVGVRAYIRSYSPPPGAPFWVSASKWVVMSRDPHQLDFFSERGWTPLEADQKRPWTDDFADVVGAYKFGASSK